MYNENKVKYDTKKLGMVTIENIDWDKMNFNYDVKVINGKLNYKKKENKVLNKKKELETELEKAKDINDIKKIVGEIIKG